MEKPKVSFTVEKITEEHNKKGPKLLKVYLRSRGKLYTKVCKKEDYLDEDTRLGLFQLWIRSLKAEMTEENKNEGKLKKDAEAIKDLVGAEVEDEED